jgi:PII-like signaling protein
MKGYQVTFFTQQGRRHGHQTIEDWLMSTAKSLGIRGLTITAGVEGIGRSGKVHSAHFFDLADQPIEATMVLDEAQCQSLFDRLTAENAGLFYVKSAVEFGVVGGTAAG